MGDVEEELKKVMVGCAEVGGMASIQNYTS